MNMSELLVCYYRRGSWSVVCADIWRRWRRTRRSLLGPVTQTSHGTRQSCTGTLCSDHRYRTSLTPARVAINGDQHGKHGKIGDLKVVRESVFLPVMCYHKQFIRHKSQRILCRLESGNPATRADLLEGW